MKNLRWLLLGASFVLLLAGRAYASAYVWWTAYPGGDVDSGEGYYIQADGSSDWGHLTNVHVWKNGAPFAFNGSGDGWTGNSGNATSDSGMQDVVFSAESYDDWSYGSGMIYWTVHVRNTAPSVWWTSAPSWVNLYSWYYVRADGYDVDNNMHGIHIYKNGNPYAFELEGNNTNALSDNWDYIGGAGATSAAFMAQAYDAYGWGGQIYFTVNYSNSQPSGSIDPHHHYKYVNDWFSFSVAGGDPNNNLAELRVYRFAWEKMPGGTVQRENWYQWDTVPSGGGPVSRTYTHQAGKPYKWEYNYVVIAADQMGSLDWPWYANTMYVLLENRAPQPPTLVPTATTYRIGDQGIVISGNGSDLDTNATNQYLWMRFKPDGQSTFGNWVMLQDFYRPGGVGDTVVNYTFNPTQTGSYEFKTKVDDPYASTIEVVQSITVDVTAPNPPSGLAKIGDFTRHLVGGNPVNLYWAQLGWSLSSATDVASQRLGYHVMPSGTETAITLGFNAAGVSVTNLQPDTTYKFYVTATDGAGNVSGRSNELVLTTPLLPEGDLDGDGLPNGWEQNFGLNPRSSADALLDNDGDGYSNVAEFNLGTSPLVAETLTSTLGGTIPAGWSAVANTSNPLAVGLTAGELSVDKSGAAGYSIPIWLSPGTAGMEPKLSLNYSSNAGAGIAGFGWSLGGASAITRGPQTRAVDGQTKSVTITQADRFYLDGQRLIYIGGGSGYGTVGAEYRTEIESFTKIVSYGARGTGPEYFKAWTKAGLIIEFGNTADSAFDAGLNPEALSWSVNKISDTKGNYITFTYAENVPYGTHQLARVDYTGNTGASVAPYASVRFEYENRDDSTTGYVAGVGVSSLQRLKYIKSYVGSTVVRTYTLNYTYRAPTSRSLLTSLTETDKDGKSYPDLRFEYAAATLGWETTTAWKSGSNYAPPYMLADNVTEKPTGAGFVDLNGDGRTDFVTRKDYSGQNEAYINNGNEWVATSSYRVPQPLAFSSGVDSGARFADLDGDGLPDMIWQRNNSSGTQLDTGVLRNTGSGWYPFSGVNYAPPAPMAQDNLSTHGAQFLDLNGDGRVDFVGHLKPSGTADHSMYVYLNTGTGWSSLHSNFSMAGGQDVAAYRARFVDLNGDGLPDMVMNYNGSGTWVRSSWINTGSGWTESTDYRLPETMLIADNVNPSLGAEFVDVNADGLPDLVWYRETGSTALRGAALNTGKGWKNLDPVADADLYNRYAPPAALSRDNNNSSGSALLDLNADGFADIGMLRQFTGQSAAVGTWYGNGRNWAPAGTGAPHDLPEYLLLSGVKNMGVDFVDLDGDGAVDIVSRRKNSNGIEVAGAWHNKSKPADRLTKVINGFDVSAQLVYKPLTDASVYAKGTGSTFPVVDLVSPMQVVAQVKHDDLVTPTSTYDINYTYAGLRAHADRGSLGFASMTVVDSRTGIVSTSKFQQVYPYIGMPYESTTTKGTATLSKSEMGYVDKVFTYASGSTHFPIAVVTTATTRDLNNAFINKTETTLPNLAADVDNYGNILTLDVDTLDETDTPKFWKTTTSTYTNDATNWLLGRLTGSTVVSGGASLSPITRVSAFEYDATSGMLTKEIVEPGNNTYKVTTTYLYDTFGNKLSATVSGQGVASRSSSTTYSVDGRFAVTSTNALGHVETYTTDANLGVLLSLKGPNGLTTSWTYDGFGQKTRETRADGTISDIRVKWAATGGLVPAGAKYLIETESQGSAPALVFKDAMGRSIQSLAINGAGVIVYQTTQYDSMGRAFKSSVPYRNDGSTIYWTETTSYDELGRPLVVVTPDDVNGNATTTFVYNGLITEAIDPLLRVTRTVKNVAGWVTSSIRNASGASSTVTHAYDALGNLTSTNAEGAITTLTYDVRGRKITMADPDMGNWTYAYNVLGELVSQTDAKLQTVTMTYDLLGRMVTRVEPEGTTTWTYDDATHTSPPAGAPTKWKGLLSSVTSPGNYSETYTYDQYGRTIKVSRNIGPGTDTYDIQQSYDGYGRPVFTTYPRNNFQTENLYNAYGFLKGVRRAGSAELYWQADMYTATGGIEREIYGNGLANRRTYSKATGRLQGAQIGTLATYLPYNTVQNLQYTYDKMGNVLTRVDGPTARSETFTYDALDRLITHARSGASTVSVAYDAKGNIINKSDVGAYTYGTATVRPHAVGNAGGVSYYYDANGNMTSGGGRALTWTSYNQVSQIEQGDYKTMFAFGAGHERVKQTVERKLSPTSTVTTTTIYVGSLFEKVTANGVDEHRFYIMGPTGRIAVRSVFSSSPANAQTRYLHTDGLGSITAVSNEAAQIVQRFAYDAWGKRVDPATNVATTGDTNGGFTRGYTDHEQLDNHGLIHMNGRIYDPVLGRFLSADPFIDGAGDPQSYNRYSYVNNNPMNATDPSGFFKLKDAIKIVAVVAVAFVTAGAAVYAAAAIMGQAGVTMGVAFQALVGANGYGLTVAGAVAAGAGAGFGSGFAGSLLNGGSIGDAFKSGAIGAVVGGISGGIAHGIGSVFEGMGGFEGWAGRSLAHGVVQGGAAELQGGEFRHGFYSGFATAAASPGVGTLPQQARWIGAAIVGGTASAIGGGKFANGAVSGAFQYLLNDSQHLKRRGKPNDDDRQFVAAYCDPSQVESTVKAGVDEYTKGGREALSRYFAIGDGATRRYVFDEATGWLDLKHVAAAYYLGQEWGVDIAFTLGWGNEYGQLLTGGFGKVAWALRIRNDWVDSQRGDWDSANRADDHWSNFVGARWGASPQFSNPKKYQNWLSQEKAIEFFYKRP